MGLNRLWGPRKCDGDVCVAWQLLVDFCDIFYSSDQDPHGPLELATTRTRCPRMKAPSRVSSALWVKCKIVNKIKRKTSSKRCSNNRVREGGAVGGMGFSGGRSCGKRGSTAYTYYPFIDKCHPAPGRNITYTTIDCVTGCWNRIKP